MSRRPLRWILAVFVAGLALLGVVIGVELHAPALPPSTEAAPADPTLLARGAELARAGNCMACHTVRGGAPYAGGRRIATPFGDLYAGNLTPDAETGLGAWSLQAFQRALHEGRSRDGRLLYPAFPYAHFTQLGDEDVAALWAHLRRLPPVRQPNTPHALRFPYSTQLALAVWRVLFFEPGRFQPDTAQSAEWNRGAYLDHGVAHCAACHGTRNAWGATTEVFGGERLPDGRWFAPSLLDPRQAGVQDWPVERVAALLKNGSAPGASVAGPMAEVVFHGTQHLPEADVNAMAGYLKTLPARRSEAPAFKRADASLLEAGGRLYQQHCADCHGEQGEGRPDMYPPLAGNRVVTMDDPTNALQAIVGGGFAPSTPGHPHPYGMPPFRTLLQDAEIAAVASFLRQSWGHQANPVNPLEVQRVR
jgi:mono/diheme cytochrome c family protein